MLSQVTVKAKVPLYKGEEPANFIELLQFEEVDFEVVRNKELSQVGDKLLLVYPDSCVPNNKLFKEYYYPYDDASKSKLGICGRVRAVKFNFHRGDGQTVYSNGIVLSQYDLAIYSLVFPNKVAGKYFDQITSEDLEITKYEPPERDAKGNRINSDGDNQFPPDLYKTNEPNILIVKNLPFPARYTIRDKEDGSSTTLWYKNGKSGICSRNLSKPLTERYISGLRKPTLWENIKVFFLCTVDFRIWEERKVNNDFIRIGLPYLHKLAKYCEKNKRNLVLRGELSGQGLNGSGNKNNKLKSANQDIRFFGLDSYDKKVERLNDDFFRDVASVLDLPVCNLAFDRVFESREDLTNTMQEYFSQNKNLEGVVARTGEHSEISVKIMNLYYDSLK